MLTQKQIDNIRDRRDQEFGPAEDALQKILDELEEAREIVFAALCCTGEDGHDGVTDLVVAAEEYLDKLKERDSRWSQLSIHDNIQRMRHTRRVGR